MTEKNIEKFRIARVNRRQIQTAYYNPRKISKEARQKLGRFIEELGMLGPIIVNERTWRVVGGHQRLEKMDSFYRRDDYELTVALVNLTDEDEVKANVGLNNTSMMGKFDQDSLIQIRESFPDLDFQKDLGFDPIEVEVLFAGTEFAVDTTVANPAGVETETSELDRMRKLDELKNAKADFRQKAKEKNLAGESHGQETNDTSLTFVFPNNVEKRAVCEALGLVPTEKFVRHTILFELAAGAYDLMGGKD